MSFTLGEVTTSYYATTASSLSEGFHQSYLDVISAIEDLEGVSAFAIFPNPTSDILHLQFEGNLNGMNGEIYNILGQKMSNVKIELSAQVDMSTLQSGTYF